MSQGLDPIPLAPFPPLRDIRLRCALCGEQIRALPSECCDLPRDFALDSDGWITFGRIAEPLRLSTRILSEVYYA